jgi:hypothetical protein
MNKRIIKGNKRMTILMDEERFRVDKVCRWRVTIHTINNYTLMFIINLKDIKNVRDELMKEESFNKISASPTEFWVTLEACRRMRKELKNKTLLDNLAYIELKPM